MIELTIYALFTGGLGSKQGKQDKQDMTEQTDRTFAHTEKWILAPAFYMWHISRSRRRRRSRSRRWTPSGWGRRTLLSARQKVSCEWEHICVCTLYSVHPPTRKWKLCDVCLQQKPGHTAFPLLPPPTTVCNEVLFQFPFDRPQTSRKSGGRRGAGQDAGVDNFMHKFIVCAGLYGWLRFEWDTSFRYVVCLLPFRVRWWLCI